MSGDTTHKLRQQQKYLLIIIFATVVTSIIKYQDHFLTGAFPWYIDAVISFVCAIVYFFNAIKIRRLGG